MSDGSPPTSSQKNSSRSAPTPPSGDWIAIGEVVGAFGIRGELKVRPLTDFPERFAHTPTVYVGDQRIPHTTLGAHLHKEMVLLQLAGIEDATAAAKLRGARLWIPAADLLPLEDDRFYLHDVIGLTVRHVNGQTLGTITDVMPSAANDIFVVRDARSGAEVLLPAVKAFVKSVDVPGGVVTVDPIPGLFDDHFDEAR